MSEKYHIPENPVYNPEIRKLKDTDPASATRTFNPLFEQMIENTAAVKKQADQIEEETGDLKEAKGQPGGLATLDDDGKIPAKQLPLMDYEEAGTAEKVQDDLNNHKEDTILHVTTSKQSEWDMGTDMASAAKAAANEAIALASDAYKLAQNSNVKLFNASIPVDGWNWDSGNNVSHITRAISGMSADYTPVIGLVPTGDVDDVWEQTAAYSLISAIETKNNNVTVYVYGNETPPVAVPVQMLVMQ